MCQFGLIGRHDSECMLEMSYGSDNVLVWD
jgi:hypothetical protein